MIHHIVEGFFGSGKAIHHVFGRIVVATTSVDRILIIGGLGDDALIGTNIVERIGLYTHGLPVVCRGIGIV